ncbi:MAG: AMP-binding protein, partial [Xanthobacteraceae bacterium]
MIESAHIDTFARDSLPLASAQPEFRFDLPELHYPDRLNAAAELLDKMIERGHGERPCILTPSETLTYGQLQERVNRIANVLVKNLGLVPGNRVLLRSANNAMMVASYLAVVKAGGVVVATMPLLRAKEIAYVIGKAKIAIALCDATLTEEMEKAKSAAPSLRKLVYWGKGGLETLMGQEDYETFSACDTAADDVCLIAFTSGTTGQPKGTMHFHRDLLAVCDTYGRHVLRANARDRFIGSPPLAFTIGTGGLVFFPLRVGASTILLERS